MMKVIFRAALAVIVAFTSLTLIGASPAGAVQQDNACYEQIAQTKWEYEEFKTQHEVDKYVRERELEGAQHYSYTGGKRSVFDPPSWPGDAGDWQANTSQEPHNDAEAGLHWQGQWWNASWFYFHPGDFGDWSEPTRWEPVGSHLAWVDDIPVANWQEHGNSYTTTYQRDWTVYPTGNTQEVSTGFVTSEWIDGQDAPDDIHPWVKIDDRNRDGDQIPCEEQPPAETRETTETSVNCETKQVVTTRDTFETPYILENFQWVLGTEVQILDNELVSSVPATEQELLDSECVETPEPKVEYSEWLYSESPACDIEVIDRVRTKTTTPYIWDQQTQSYVEDTENIVVVEEVEQVYIEPEPCPIPVVVAEPTLEANCEGYFTVTIDNPEGVRYEWFNLPTGLGTSVNFNGPTTVRVAYYADEVEYTIEGWNEFVVDIPAPEDCPEEVTTTTTTDEVEIVAVSSTSDTLPDTGTETWMELVFGALFILFGASLVFGAHKLHKV